MENTIRKKIIASSAAYILGMQPQVEIQGTSKQVQKFKEVLDASKNLYNVLQEGTYEDIENGLRNKKELAKNFYQEFGWQWPF